MYTFDQYEKARLYGIFRIQKRSDTESDGFQSPAEESDLKKRKVDAVDGDGQWETWPDEEFEEAAREEQQEELEELETLSQLEEADRRRRHGKEIVPNPKKEGTPEEEWWDCPICLRPQKTDEKEFNEHIDLCLSRQTIREVIQDTSRRNQTSREAAPDPKRLKGNKKDRHNSSDDTKQRRLFFG